LTSKSIKVKTEDRRNCASRQQLVRRFGDRWRRAERPEWTDAGKTSDKHRTRECWEGAGILIWPKASKLTSESSLTKNKLKSSRGGYNH